MFEQALRLAKERQTYRNILYLLTAFPLGLFYFVFLIVGISLGLGTLIIWVGVLILFLTVSAWWYMAAFERTHTMNWLGVGIAPMHIPTDESQTFWQRFRSLLYNRVTWKSLAYLLLKFIFGLCAFVLLVSGLACVLTLSILSLILALTLGPLLYGIWLLTSNTLFSAQSSVFRQRSRLTITQWSLYVITGYGLLLSPLYLFNALASMWGEFARTMLGMSDNAIRMAEAERIVRQERAKAERAEQSRKELIVNVSHELRTPVASIRGHIESLLITIEDTQKSLKAEELHSYLSIVYREATSLGMLVDDLLALARNDASELSLDLTAVNAGEVVEEVYQSMMPLARRQRQITLVRTITPTISAVQADRRRLLQVLLNLVRNAITYTPDGGIVSIMLVQTSAGTVELQVADTGIGIPEADLDKIFERFYRTDASRARTSGGFGLGLAIVRDFVHAMGGTVFVESKVGEGTCFRVILQPSFSP